MSTLLNLEADIDSLKNFGSSKDIIKEELKKLFVRILAVYDKTIKTNPWIIGMTGGGVPVKTGKLRDSHTKEITAYSAKIIPRTDYASKVHEKRPWLEYAMTTNQKSVNELISQFIIEVKNKL